MYLCVSYLKLPTLLNVANQLAKIYVNFLLKIKVIFVGKDYSKSILYPLKPQPGRRLPILPVGIKLCNDS